MNIGWVLCDGIMGASSRMNAINPHNWLNEHGIESTIIEECPGTVVCPRSTKIEEAINKKEITHLIFQKVCLGRALDYVKLAKQRGIITVYTVDDLLPEGTEMESTVDLIEANSYFTEDYLWTKIHRKSTYIPVCYESPRDLCKNDYNTNVPTIFWFGSLGNAIQSSVLQNLIVALGYKYEILSTPPIATIPWTLTYYNELVKADIMVVPNFDHINKLIFQAKGESRPMTGMVLGIPVVTSPYPSYSKIITNGITGFICYLNDLEEFEEYLDYLRDVKVREDIGRAGRQRVLDDYSPDVIGQRWVTFLKGEK